MDPMQLFTEMFEMHPYGKKLIEETKKFSEWLIKYENIENEKYLFTDMYEEVTRLLRLNEFNEEDFKNFYLISKKINRSKEIEYIVNYYTNGIKIPSYGTMLPLFDVTHNLKTHLCNYFKYDYEEIEIDPACKQEFIKYPKIGNYIYIFDKKKDSFCKHKLYKVVDICPKYMICQIYESGDKKEFSEVAEYLPTENKVKFCFNKKNKYLLRIKNNPIIFM